MVISQYQNVANMTFTLYSFPTSHTLHTWWRQRVHTALVMTVGLCHNFDESQKVASPPLSPALASLPLELENKSYSHHTIRPQRKNVKKACLLVGKLTYWLADHPTSVGSLNCHHLDPSSDVCLAWKIHLELNNVSVPAWVVALN